MKTYFCKNGEAVSVESDPDNIDLIRVLYKGKWYSRLKNCIGRTLFSENPHQSQSSKGNYGGEYTAAMVEVNSIVTLVNVDTKETSVVHIIDAQTSVKYLAMGGSYYGARTEEISDSRAGQIYDDILFITDISPIGKALIGKEQGDQFSVKVGSCETVFQIESVDNREVSVK